MAALASTWITLTLQVLREGVHHLLRLVQAQQAVVDEHAGELLADRLVDQRRRHRGIDAAGQAEDHLFLADLLFYFADGFGNVIRHVPVAAAAADLAHEAVQQPGALPGMRDFGMELHRVEAARLVGHAGDRAGLGRGHQLEARRHRDHLVAVAHPDLEHARRRSGRGSPRCRRAASYARARALRRSRTRAPCPPRPCRPAAAPWSACRSRCRAPARPVSKTALGALQRRFFVGRGMWLPERITPFGAKSRTKASLTSQGWISQ